ncbi:hypothetical protein C2I27_22870 [Priestia megaterium]|nr:hypothetical protein C2I27_22870 [Priestia megaterium]
MILDEPVFFAINTWVNGVGDRHEMCLQYLMIQASKRNHERVKQEVKQKTANRSRRKTLHQRYKNNCSLERRCEDEMEITVGLI